MQKGKSNGDESVIKFWLHLQHFLDARRTAARNAGLDSSAYELLLALKAFPEGVDPNISTMSKRLMLQHRVAARVVKRLARRGLVRTHRGRYDHRCRAVRLTPKGLQLLSKLASASMAGLATDAPPLAASLRQVRASGGDTGRRYSATSGA
jgi:DNA-binding MarR family transcriptional regulator